MSISVGLPPLVPTTSEKSEKSEKVEKVEHVEPHDKSKPERAEKEESVLRKRSSGLAVQAQRKTEDLSVTNAKWQNLQNLKALLNEGFLTKTEYAERKAQLIDEMTGTTLGAGRSQSIMSKPLPPPVAPISLPTIINRPPPDFGRIPSEKGTKFEYDLESKKWRETSVMVKLDPTPFSRGALRLVYHLQDLSVSERKKKGKSEDEKPISFVAKLSMDPRDVMNRDIYFRDVEMQTVAKYYAQKFNDYNPPKKVDFVNASLLRLESREGQPMCGVERYIDGPYRKHNNNFGFVNEDERSTPQAFSHFTYECSNHQLLVCDIQGVSDCYTDPQVHSADGKGYGKGNMGQRGIDEFLRTHRCNAICRYFKLPAINAKEADLGTLPVQRFMSYERVQVVHIGDFPEFPGAMSSSVRSPLVRRDSETAVCRAWCTIL